MLRAEIICQSKVDAVAVLTAPFGGVVWVLLAVLVEILVVLVIVMADISTVVGIACVLLTIVGIT